MILDKLNLIERGDITDLLQREACLLAEVGAYDTAAAALAHARAEIKELEAAK